MKFNDVEREKLVEKYHQTFNAIEEDMPKFDDLKLPKPVNALRSVVDDLRRNIGWQDVVKRRNAERKRNEVANEAWITPSWRVKPM